ncbi:hypothetical protein GCM10011321_25470 [Youhaiella tibetensis]|nr:hypothetical protein GCM10011321_25470 [Youhaiella tibetensis]
MIGHDDPGLLGKTLLGQEEERETGEDKEAHGGQLRGWRCPIVSWRGGFGIGTASQKLGHPSQPLCRRPRQFTDWKLPSRSNQQLKNFVPSDASK